MFHAKHKKRGYKMKITGIFKAVDAQKGGFTFFNRNTQEYTLKTDLNLKLGKKYYLEFFDNMHISKAIECEYNIDYVHFGVLEYISDINRYSVQGEKALYSIIFLNKKKIKRGLYLIEGEIFQNKYYIKSFLKI